MCRDHTNMADLMSHLFLGCQQSKFSSFTHLYYTQHIITCHVHDNFIHLTLCPMMTLICLSLIRGFLATHFVHGIESLMGAVKCLVCHGHLIYHGMMNFKPESATYDLQQTAISNFAAFFKNNK